MSETLGFAHFLQNADAVARVVLALLIGMSVGSWYLIAARSLQTFSSYRRGRSFLAAFRRLPSLEAIEQGLDARAGRDPFSRLARQAFAAIELHRARAGTPGQGASGAAGARGARLVDAGSAESFIERSLERAIAQDVARLERGQTFLATVASTAPFVGLFGTVWGIHHALVAIGATGNAGLDAVASPVGEALIMTGIGLAVAIPAAVAYNAFARVRRNTRLELQAFAWELFVRLGTGGTTPPFADAGEGGEPAAGRSPVHAAGAAQRA